MVVVASPHEGRNGIPRPRPAGGRPRGSRGGPWPSETAGPARDPVGLRRTKLVSTDRLIEEMWPHPPETAANALQVYVHKLRNALEPERGRGAPGELLVTQAPGYALRVAPDQLDARSVRAPARRRQGGGRGRRPGGRGPAASRGSRSLAGPGATRTSPTTPSPRRRSRAWRSSDWTRLEDRIEADLALGGSAELVAEARGADQPQPPSRAVPRTIDARAISGGPAGGRARGLRRDAPDSRRRTRARPRARRCSDSRRRSSARSPRSRSRSILRRGPARRRRYETTGRGGGAQNGDRPDRATAERSRGLDPEALSRDGKLYRAHLQRTVERHGGAIASSLGDEVLAVFGVPRAHEDDAFRAVAAALQVGEAPDDGATAASAAPRIGIATGEVLASASTTGELSVIGEPLTEAGELEDAAGAGRGPARRRDRAAGSRRTPGASRSRPKRAARGASSSCGTGGRSSAR